MGEAAGGTWSKTGSECRGGDGAIGLTGCDPSPPTLPWSAALPEILEAVEEPSLLEVSRRAFLAARSASLEVRWGPKARLRAAAAVVVGAMVAPTRAETSASTLSRSIGLLE